MSEHITLITVLFTAVLAFALLIERAIEVLKTIYNLVDSRYDHHRFWTRRTHAIQALMEHRLRVFEYVDPKGAAAVFNRFNDMLLGPADGYKGTVPMLCGDFVRAVHVRIGCKVVGIVLGVALAFGFGFDVLAAVDASTISEVAPGTGGMLVTGIAMGLGAGPVHKLIRVVEKKRAANFPQVVTHG